LCLAFSAGGLLVYVGAGIPPRRAGNFLLLAQKKVTKEKSLDICLAPCGGASLGEAHLLHHTLDVRSS
jgi:hypothetical protein